MWVVPLSHFGENLNFMAVADQFALLARIARGMVAWPWADIAAKRWAKRA